MHIDAHRFSRYEAVRRSGVTNMWNIKLVCDLADLKKDEVMEIMKKYSSLKEQLTPYLCESEINENAENMRGMFSEKE